eukprot:1909118-Alexandrium_andersonii.AAC.1
MQVHAHANNCCFAPSRLEPFDHMHMHMFILRSLPLVGEHHTSAPRKNVVGPTVEQPIPPPRKRE